MEVYLKMPIKNIPPRREGPLHERKRKEVRTLGGLRNQESFKKKKGANFLLAGPGPVYEVREGKGKNRELEGPITLLIGEKKPSATNRTNSSTLKRKGVQ